LACVKSADYKRKGAPKRPDNCVAEGR